MDTILAHVHLRGLSDCLRAFLAITPAHEYSSALFRHDESCSALNEACQNCALKADAPSQARPISPPFNPAGESHYSCYLDFHSRIYQIFWSNAAQYPNLSRFPKVDGTVHLVALSDTMTKVLAASVLLDYGTDACIRCSHLEPLPIIKIALPNKISRLRIRNEFKMLKEMKRCSLPVPSFGNEPPIDEEGIFGYRMELLTPIDFSDLGLVSEDLKTIVGRVHDSGLSHGDLNPSNIMRNGSGSLVIIDPSFAGRLGQQIPDHITSPQYESNVFCTTADERYMKMFFG